MSKRTSDTAASAAKAEKAAKLMTSEERDKLKAELDSKSLLYCRCDGEGRFESYLLPCSSFTALQLAQMVSDPCICNEDTPQDHPYLTEKEYEDMVESLAAGPAGVARMKDFSGVVVAFVLHHFIVL